MKLEEIPEENKIYEEAENYYWRAFLFSCIFFFGGLYLAYKYGIIKEEPPRYYYIIPLGLTYFVNKIIRFFKGLNAYNESDNKNI